MGVTEDDGLSGNGEVGKRRGGLWQEEKIFGRQDGGSDLGYILWHMYIPTGIKKEVGEIWIEL